MSKTIDTLISDIYEVLDSDSYTLTGSSVREKKEPRGGLWFSNVGRPCKRQLWYSVNHPGEGEDVLPHTKLKFAYGDILEDVILDLAEMAGHTVSLRQHRAEIGPVSGRIDAVIDGVVVDVKTASKFSFNKFKEGLTIDKDDFGYLGQLSGYLVALQEKEEVTEKNKAAFLVINKETGALHLDVHTFDSEELLSLPRQYEELAQTVAGREPPERTFAPEPDGKSGNYKLGIECSYCPYRLRCYPEARTFLYAGGPRYLTTVVNTPKVPEVDEEGNLVGGFTF